MTRTRVWTLTALVTLALVINLGLLSSRAAQKAGSNVSGRLAAATKALRAQLELADSRATPRIAAQAPQLAEVLKPPDDPTLPPPRPDERALRATAAVFEGGGPDLLLVANADGAALSRKGKPAAILPDLSALAPVKGMLEGAPLGPLFLSYDGQLFRVHGAKIPGGAGVVLTGQQVNDAFASALRASIDAEVTFLKEGAVAGSSLDGAVRTQLAEWAKLPGLGFGVLRLHLPLLDGAFDGTLPFGSDHLAIRTSNVALESGVTAVVSIDAASQLAWLGRYQAFYLGLLLFLVLVGLALGNVSDPEPPRVVVTRPATAPLKARGDSKPDLKAVPKGDGKSAPELLAVKPPPEKLNAAKAEKPDAALASPLLQPTAEASPSAIAPLPAAAAEVGHGIDPKQPEGAPGPAGGLDGPIALPGPLGAAAPRGAEPLDLKAEVEDAKAERPGDPIAPPQPTEEPLEALASQQTRIEPVPQELLQKLRERDEEVAAAQVPAPVAPAVDPWALALPPPSESTLSSFVAPKPLDGATLPEPSQPPEPDAPAGAPAALPEASSVPESLEAAPLQALPADAPPPADSALADAAPEPVAVSLPPPAAEAAPEEGPAAEPPAEDPQASGAPAAQAAAAPLGDPDEAHFLDTFRRFVELRQQTGEPSDRVSYEKFVAKLKKNREDLIAKHSAKGVRFSVYVKDGKASIKASAIR